MTIKRMLADFLEVPGNMAAIEDLCGAGSRNKPAPALWDAASLRHGKRCRTFDEAFAACCVGRRRAGRIEHGWAWFDLATMRECVPGLDLPAWVYEAQAEAAEREMARGLEELALAEQEAWYADGGGLDEEEAGEVLVLVDEEMIEGEAVALPLPPWAWRRAA